MKIKIKNLGPYFFFYILIFSTFGIFASSVPSSRVPSLSEEIHALTDGIDNSQNELTDSIKFKIKNLENAINNEKEKLPYVEGEVIIKYREDQIDLKTSVGDKEGKEFLQSMSLEKREDLLGQNISVVKIIDSKTVEEKILEIEKDPNVEYVQPNFIYYPSSINTNDTDRSKLWGLENTGQIVNGVSGQVDKDIDAPEAWVRSEGAGVIVAVIDDGVAYNHPDLIGNMWDGTNCVNELGDALGGCIYGYDYDANDRDPYPNDFEQDSHGTHVAGIISSRKNNGLGIMGVAPESNIMALKTNLSTSQILKAISFAERNDADIINASWGMSFQDGALLAAINSFSGLFITSAGNGLSDSDPEGDNHDSGQTLHSYPCDYISSNIICVAATDQNDNLTSWSDYGSTSVDVGAPGSNVLSTLTYKNVVNEAFYDVPLFSLPGNWARYGDNNSWGVRSVTNLSGEKMYFLVGDTYKPYLSNAHTYVVSPIYNLGNVAARIKFTALCDTPYSSFRTDYMWTNFTTNGGASWSSGTWWDEYVLYNNFVDSFRPTDYPYMVIAPEVSMDIPLEYVSENTQLAISWLSNGYDNDYWGCGISNLQVVKKDMVYDFMSGTSMATPHVAGIAALVWSYRPDLSITEVKDAILSSGDSVASLIGKTSTGKRVNAYNALVSVQGDIIDTFKFSEGGVDYPCTVSEKSKTISCSLPGDVPKTNLTTSISLTGGEIVPNSGTPINYFENNTYTFTKSDLTEEIYTLNISDYSRPFAEYRSYAGNWSVPQTKFLTSGDYNADGVDDKAFIYDYGNNDMGIYIFSEINGEYVGNLWYRSGAGNWGVPQTKFVSTGDYDNDGIDDIGIIYDYGNNDMGIYIFKSLGTYFLGSLKYRSGAGNWGVPQTKFVSTGDYDNDGIDDIGLIYDYGNNDMGIYIFKSLGTSFLGSLKYRSGVGNWGVPQTKFMSSGDYNGNGVDDIGIIYDYGNNDMGLYIFQFNGDVVSGGLWYRSGAGNWGVPQTKFMSSGDYNGNGIDDVGIIYDYGNNDMGLYVFQFNGGVVSGGLWYRSGAGNWGVPQTKFMSSGDYNANSVEEVNMVYDYGNNDMGIFVFR